MAITFVTKYPSTLKNAAWQKSKSFKDKTKAKTKTGLGDALNTAEKDWGKIDFDKLDADKQDLDGKSLNELQAAKRQAQDYLDGQIVTKAIASLDAASKKSNTTAANQALSNTAATAARTLSGALLRQAKLLRDIKLADFTAQTGQVVQSVAPLERTHTQLLKSMDDIRDDIKDSNDTATWLQANIGAVIDNAVRTTQSLTDLTGDQNWRANHEKWTRLNIMFTASDRIIKANPGVRAVEEMKDFADVIQGSLGGMWS
jgi:hypothetical protein